MIKRYAAIEGIGFWAPQLPSWAIARSVLRGEGPAASAPAPRPMPPALRASERRAIGDTIAISFEVAARACEAANRDPASLASVFASTYGDLPITHFMCETLARTPSLLSPTLFNDSTHNAAAGHWAIAMQCQASYTALAAGRRTFAEGLLEALLQVESEGLPVLYVAYDVEARGPLAAVARSRGSVALAFVLSPAAEQNERLALRWEVASDPAPSDTGPQREHAELLAGNGMANCLPLLAALADAGPRQLHFALGPTLSLELAVMGALEMTHECEPQGVARSAGVCTAAVYGVTRIDAIAKTKAAEG
ncbi:MAG TPA: beta-ketoacyl synthase chain length factor [Burkholderiales bacterium]|nr:beta-ketoacyl synthase chain length factor [Burkholderiales bacterium]